MPVLMLLFIVIPIIEITVLINVGSMIGVWSTVGLVLLSAFIGVNMLRYQGLATLASARARMQRNELPAQEMMEGLVLAVGGALLITPGFVTDVLGFCCLLPFTRRALVAAVKKRAVVTGSSSFGQSGPNASFYSTSARSDTRPNEGDIVDAEYVDLDAEKINKK